MNTQTMNIPIHGAGPTCACGRMCLRSSSANHLGSAVSWLQGEFAVGSR